jgi:hypothetical protein
VGGHGGIALGIHTLASKINEQFAQSDYINHILLLFFLDSRGATPVLHTGVAMI